jgi:hypothetical protein
VGFNNEISITLHVARRSWRRSIVKAKESDSKTIPRLLHLFHFLGPRLITGAADDDPSGIATYSQIGAQFGLTTLWTLVFAYPLMAAGLLPETPTVLR